MSTAFRSTSKGDNKDLRLTVQELNQQLQDSKNQNRLLGTENARLKKTCDQLSSRLVDVEAGRSTKHGEAATIGALRNAALMAKQQKVEFISNYQQAMDEISSLMSEVADLQQQLAAQQHTEQTLRIALQETLNDAKTWADAAGNTDKQLHAVQQQLLATMAELQATKQELSNEQGRRSQAEARLDETKNRISSQQDQATATTTSIQGKLAATEQALTNTKVLVSELEAKIKALQQQSVDEQQQTRALRCHIEGLQQASQSLSPPTPFKLSLASDLIPSLKAGPVQPASKNSHTGILSNTLYIMLHSMSLHPAKMIASQSPGPASVQVTDQSQWMLLSYSAPGVHTAMDTVLVGTSSGDQCEMGLCHTIRLPDCKDAGDDQALLRALAVGRVNLTLWDVRRNLVGACRIPIDNDVQPVLVATCAYGQGRAACKLISVIDSATSSSGQQQASNVQRQQGGPSTIRPGKVVQELSTDWQRILPINHAPPSAAQIVVSLRGVHPLVLESLRVSGLFLPGRTFTGTDNAPYQVWDFNTLPARKNATTKYLDMDLGVCDFSKDTAIRPTATLDLPLSYALDAPDQHTLQSRHLHQLIHQQSNTSTIQSLYEPCERNGTISAIMRTSADAAVATCQVTMRFEKSVGMTSSVLAACTALDSPPPSLQAASTQRSSSTNGVTPDNQPGTSTTSGNANIVPRAPALPPSHWGAAMAAELVGAGRLVMDLDAAVDVALSACMYQQPYGHTASQVDITPGAAVVAVGTAPTAPGQQQPGGATGVDAEISEHGQQVAYVHDVAGRLKQLLPSYMASCCGVLGIAEQAGEGPTARSWLQSVAAALGRLLLNITVKVEYQRHLCASSAATWAHFQQVSPHSETSGSAVATWPCTPSTAQQNTVQHIAQLLRALIRDLGFPPIPETCPSVRDSQQHAAATDDKPPTATAAVGNPCSRGAALRAYLSCQLHDAVVKVMPLNKYLKQSIEQPLQTNTCSTGQPGTPLLLTQQRLKEVLSDLQTMVNDCRQRSSSANMAGAGGDYVMFVQSCQHQAASALTNVTMAVLDDIHSWARRTGSCWNEHGQDGRSGATHDKDDSNTTAGATAAASLYQSCTTLFSQLAVELCQLSKVEPTSLPPTSSTTASSSQSSSVQWLKASHRLSWQLCDAVTYWTMCAAAVVSEMCKSLSVDPVTSVSVVMEALTGEAVRVVQLVQARLIDTQASKVYSQQEIQDSVEVLLPLLKHSMQQACLLPLSTACCVLSTPTHEASLHLKCTPKSSTNSMTHSAAGTSVHLRIVGLEGSESVHGQGHSHGRSWQQQGIDNDANHSEAGCILKPLFDSCLWNPRRQVLVINPTGAPSGSTQSAHDDRYAKQLPVSSTEASYSACIAAALQLLDWRYVTMDDAMRRHSAASAPEGPRLLQQPDASEAMGPAVPQQQDRSGRPDTTQEGHIIADTCRTVDAVIVLPPSSECGSVISRSKAAGALVLVPDQDSELLAAMDACCRTQYKVRNAGSEAQGQKQTGNIPAGSSGDSNRAAVISSDDIPEHRLCRLIVARCASHRLRVCSRAAGQELTISTTSSTAQNELQWLQPPHVQQLVSTSQSCILKVARAVDSMQAAVQTSMLLRPLISRLVSETQASMLSQHLMYVGLIQALNMDFNPEPRPHSMKQVNVPVNMTDPGIAFGVKRISGGGSGLPVPSSPLLSRMPSGVNVGAGPSRRPSLPAMQRLSGTGATSRGHSASGFHTAAPAVQSGSLSEFVSPNMARSQASPQVNLQGLTAAANEHSPYATRGNTQHGAEQRGGGGSTRSALLPQQKAEAIVGAMMPPPGGVHGAGGDSTESGEFEAGVLSVHMLAQSNKAPQYIRDWDVESDAASVVSSSGYSMSHTRT